MSNGRAHRRHKRTPLDRYADALAAAGMPEREVARAVFYVRQYGFDALQPGADGCCVFGEPSCENWNCLNPEHQRFAS